MLGEELCVGNCHKQSSVAEEEESVVPGAGGKSAKKQGNYQTMVLGLSR